jgi:anti-anti-sigma factor
MGDLDWTGAMTLPHALHDVLQPGIKLCVDLSQVGYIDALGASPLVGAVRRLRAAGGEMQLSYAAHMLAVVRRRSAFTQLCCVHPQETRTAATATTAKTAASKPHNLRATRSISTSAT